MKTIDFRLPKWFIPYESHTRYKGIVGGRGSGKTTTVARHLTELAHCDSSRFLLCRDKTVSLKQSTYASIVKAINEMGLRKVFDIKQSGIYSIKTGSEFIFTGLHQKAEDLKSLEDIRYVWGDQAEKFSAENIQHLTPTIRADNSELWFTWNRRYATDAVEILFNKYSDDALLTHVNYDQNPFFPPSLEIERKLCQKHMSEDYAHIWLGDQREANIARVLMSYQDLLTCKGAAKRIGYVPQGHHYMGLDIADGGKDVPAYAIRQGAYLQDVRETQDKNGYKLAKTIFTVATDYPRLARCHYDVTGVGASMKAEFERAADTKRLHFYPDPFLFGGKVFSGKVIYAHNTTNAENFTNASAQGYWNLKMKVKNTIDLLNGQKVPVDKCLFLADNIQENALRELAQIEYEKDNNDKIRVIKAPKGKDSPNLADAIMMSFARDIFYGLKAY